MDIHPWTKYEIARIRDEERLLRARAALRAKEARAPADADAAGEDVGQSLFGWLLRRRPVADSRSVRARPA